MFDAKKKNAKAFRSKKRRDRRVTLDAEGRVEHTRLFHRVPKGKAKRPRDVWNTEALWNKAHAKEVRDENRGA